MEINLTKDTIVDKRTGEVSAPGEYVENLRAIEANIQHADDEIVSAKAALKHAQDSGFVHPVFVFGKRQTVRRPAFGTFTRTRFSGASTVLVRAGVAGPQAT